MGQTGGSSRHGVGSSISTHNISVGCRHGQARLNGFRRGIAGRRRSECDFRLGRSRLLGTEPAPRARRDDRTSRCGGSATSTQSRLERFERRYPSVTATRDVRRRARRPERRCGRDRDARLHPLRPRVAARSRQASTPSSRSRSRPRREEAEELLAASPRRAGCVLMCGHTFVYSPPVRAVKELLERERARRDVLHLLEPRQPRSAPARRERDLGPRAARLLDPSLLARARCRTRCARSGATRSSRGSPTSRSSR